MELLTESQRETLRRMSSERIQGRLMRAGLDEEEIYAMDRQTLLAAMADIMHKGADAAVKVQKPHPLHQLKWRWG